MNSPFIPKQELNKEAQGLFIEAAMICQFVFLTIGFTLVIRDTQTSITQSASTPSLTSNFTLIKDRASH